MKKVRIGDTVYFENKKGKIDSFICNKITEDECGFVLHSKGRKRIYFDQALEETDPKVIEYKQQNKNKE
jgi:hypothetical protein